MIQDWCKVLEAGAQAMAAPQKNPQDHPTNTASWGHLPAPPPQSQHALTPETPHYETHSFLWGKDYRKDCTQTSSPSRAAQADTKPTPEGSPPPALRSCQGSTRCWNLLLQHPTSITLPSNTPIPFFFFLFSSSCEVMKQLGGEVHHHMQRETPYLRHILAPDVIAGPVGKSPKVQPRLYGEGISWHPALIFPPKQPNVTAAYWIFQGWGRQCWQKQVLP